MPPKPRSATSVSLIRRVHGRLQREFSRVINRQRDCHRPTLTVNGGASRLLLPHRFGFLGRAFVSQLASAFPAYPDLVRRQAQQAVEHRFNLLGSGWVTVAHGIHCSGINGVLYPDSHQVKADGHGAWLAGRINRVNLAGAQSVWRLVEDGYMPIDWQLDFKSGYRWGEDTWYRDIRFGHMPGVDVKVPWELARMQHLPTLAIASHFSNAGLAGFQPADSYAREFRNQVLDFIAMNPPRFGVNWAIAMEVAIRVANMLVARDVFVASGTEFDDDFELVFQSSVIAHARHIVGNLEWLPQMRGNHYLADIVGLLFAASFLPCDEEVDAWLAFSVQELISEVACQYHEDGSHFEASVCYHRLSSEMVLWAFALLANLPEDKRRALARYRHESLNTTPRLRPGPIPMHPISGCDLTSPLPDWCWDRMTRMADFTEAMTKPNDLVAQFGDNDSGRFITLGSGEQLRADNEPSSPAWSLDHRALIAGIDALHDPGTGQSRAPIDVGSNLIAGLAGVTGRRTYTAEPQGGRAVHAPRLDDDAAWREVEERFRKAQSENRWTCSFPSNTHDLLRDLQSSAFTGMGCYVFRAPKLYLAVRCGEIGLAGLGAHAHCDQLAIELVLNGKELARDPGTYLYTPFPDWRNAYRSAAAHHVPRTPGREPGKLARGPFDFRGAAEGECLYFGPRGFIGRHDGYGPWVYRIIALENDKVLVHDFGEGGLRIVDPTPAGLAFSPGYGRLAAM